MPQSAVGAAMQTIAGSVTAPQGFRASAVAAGLKPSGAADLALVVSDVPATAAGTFTTSQVKAACVTYDSDLIAQQLPMRAIICNAGQANACTGTAGAEDNLTVVSWLAQALNVEPNTILTASTGVIGRRLDLAKFEQGIAPLVAGLAATPEAGEAASKAIITTDLVTKTIAIEATINGRPVRLGGMSKGSGMIHPNMATMLAFITCDAAVPADLWQAMLREAMDLSFNQITVDGDTSTNDMALALANGASGVVIEPGTEAAATLQTMLNTACIHLAKAIARDGEGATKLLEITVRGASTAQDARQIARTIASSPLVKSAAFGCDPNWGRVVAAAGRAGVTFDASAVNVWLGDFQLMQAGMPLEFDRQAASTYLKNDPVTFVVELSEGDGSGTAWGCDLSYDYVRINAEYTT